MLNYFKKNIFIVCLLLCDITAIYSALVSHKFITTHFTTISFKELSSFLTATFPFVALLIPLIAYRGLYTKRFSLGDEIRKTIKIVVFVFIIFIVIIFSQKDTYKLISIKSLSFLAVIVILFLTAFRFSLKNIFYGLGLAKERVLIIGAGDAGVSVVRGIENEKYLGYEIVGFLDDDPAKKGQLVAGKKVFGNTRHLSKFVEMLTIETIIIAVPSLAIDKLTGFVGYVQKYAKRVIFIPNLKGIALLNTELYHFFMEQLFLIQINNNLKSAGNRFIKRSSDVVLSLILLPLLLPIIMVIGALIKLESPGPIVYVDPRIGEMGRHFKMYKFRSMFIDADRRLEEFIKSDLEAQREWETNFKLKNDPRTTKIGKFLRITSLDELPQIFNVLKGEMSFVGPRPIMIVEKEKYNGKHVPYYNLVKPGITGLWQVSGRNNANYDLRVRLNTWYILNWSLWLDIVILFKTMGVVLKREGAY
ncbi:MAG: undecaprenyl-phosphate galactose phosphotransferase WbaP [Nitrospirae bacterium]|nr:undecaprenyl-phosphate galactose phosphotransferase WbaP [Nitrospirota bacterium]